MSCLGVIIHVKEGEAIRLCTEDGEEKREADRENCAERKKRKRDRERKRVSR